MAESWNESDATPFPDEEMRTLRNILQLRTVMRSVCFSGGSTVTWNEPLLLFFISKIHVL